MPMHPSRGLGHHGYEGYQLCAVLVVSVAVLDWQLYLSSGNTITFIARCYHMGNSTALVIIKDTCTVLINVLTPQYLSQPTEKDWKRTSTAFLRDCNLPNCVGAIGCKKVVIEGPFSSSNGKNFDVIFLAICDTNYNFIAIDVEDYGGTGKYCPPDFIDRETEDGTVEPGGWREFYAGAFLGLNRIGANHAAADAYKARDDLSHYLLTPAGEILGQWKYIKREQSGIEWELKMDT
ncbi:unnamed protein product [Timema podura]|uniref:Uncharacterized protein n=1 Tax=Timema podura TaxID=61482 RepID=A0ABN7NTT4_TIMPD|nr:unnamed protein product [Timema podura]